MGESPLAFSEQRTSGSFCAQSHPAGLGYVRSESRSALEEYGLKHHVNIYVNSIPNTENPMELEGNRDAGIQPIASLQYPERTATGCAVGGVSEEWQGNGIREERL